MTQLTIGILLFDGAEELDFVGPYEVFTMANFTASLQGKEPPFKVALISETGDDITGAKKMRFGIDYSLKTAPALDVICIPGGEGTRTLIHNKPVIDWVGKTAADCTWVTSVCTGAFVLSAAGLTKGRNMTTHWAAMNEFEKLGLKGNLQQGVRYVRDGNLVTAAGVSAGIDMALWLTGEIGGIPLARATQKNMEYDPAPPYAADA
ncbi:MAG: DJ-1/PfpI family protein [Fimbriimonadaceae bacterium]|nr:DJ-1/PfpI family protein [Alphaproteobacteria bacterium]